MATLSGGKFAPNEPLGATRLNQLVDLAVSNQPAADPNVSRGPGGFVVRQPKKAQEFPWNLVSFRHISSIHGIVTIGAGIVRAPTANYLIAQTAVTLAGTPEWVYVQFNRSTLTGTIEHGVVEPVSDATNLRQPLMKFGLVAGIYYLLEIRHVGEVVDFGGGGGGYEPDNDSIELSTGGTLQSLGWDAHANTTTAPSTGDGVMVRLGGLSGTLEYVTWATIKTYFAIPTVPGYDNKSVALNDVSVYESKGFKGLANSTTTPTTNDGVFVRIGGPNGTLAFVTWATIRSYYNGITDGDQGHPQLFKLTGIGTTTVQISAGRMGTVVCAAGSVAGLSAASTMYYIFVTLTGTTAVYSKATSLAGIPTTPAKVLGAVTTSGGSVIETIVHYNYGEIQGCDPDGVDDVLTVVSTGTGGRVWKSKPPGAQLPAATTQYKVLTVNGSLAWIEDWTRAHA